MHLILARAIDCTAERCRAQRLDGGVHDAPLAARMIALGTRIGPGQLVALDRDTTPPTIRWRFEVRRVEALTAERLTILGRSFRYTDRRPQDERTPLRVGDMVTIRVQQAADAIDILDTLHDGQPRHPEYLEAQFPQIAAIYDDPAQA